MEKDVLIYISKNMQDLTFILANKNYNKLGALSNVDQETVVFKKTMHGDELSFDVYKTLNDREEYLWDSLVDFKLIWVKELNEYFQITISLNESSSTTIKSITGTSLCEAELSQTNLYGVEINTDDDIAREDYNPTTFYNADDPETSLLNRILSKVPQYTIKHVDSSLAKIQRTFSIDGTSILDFLNGDCAEQFDCLFTFDSTDRSISAYDLECTCNDCGKRDDMNKFTHVDENGTITYICPKCGSTSVKYYGEDTKIFVDKENLTEEVQLETDTDSVKNCFKIVAGDDLMTSTAMLLNNNGTDYIYYVSDDQKKDMPKELVDKLEEYDTLCETYNDDYENVVTEIYNASDKLYYYQNTMMPTIEVAEVTASTEAAKLTAQNLSPVALSSVTSSTSKATVESALKNYAKVYVKSGYVKLEINDSSYTYKGEDSDGNNYGTWTGNFRVTNYSDEEDIVYSSTITIKVYDDYDEFITQKIKKTVLSDVDDDSVFDVLSIEDLSNFKSALTNYCLERLKSFYDAIQSALDVLVQMDQASEGADLYEDLYIPYYNKLQACQSEMDARQKTVDEWQTKYDNAIITLQKIQKLLNFENFIGTELYKVFCCYRREDTYQNDNYISDGLENQELIERAKQFIEDSKKELVKSATMQHSISTTLYNLMLIPEFKPILDSFEVGNWIRVRVDGEIYKLRLIEYTISFSDTNTISVEFSDVTRVNDSVNDVASILKDAQSTASSFSYISKQAENGKEASDNLNDILTNGLNSAWVNIKNNDREEITITNHGLLGREYNDITDSYDDEQVLLTHNILAYTSDSWKSVSLGLGKHKYTKYDEKNNKFVIDEDYGLSSKFVTAGYIYGSQIISGDIYSSNYSSTAGSHINLKDGSFSFAGGKFSYDSKSNNMILKGVTIKWDSSTPPEITDIDGLNEQLSGIDDYLNQLDGRIQSFSQITDPSTNWITVSLKEQHIGDLWFNPNNGLTKRWTGSSWETITDSILESLAKSKAQVFTAKPTVAYFKGDMLIPVETFIFNGVTYTKGRAYRALKDSNSITFNNSDWDELDYTNDSALDEYKKDIENFQGKVNKALTGSTNEIGEDYIISPKIGGGYLYIKNKSDKRSVTIDPQQTYSSSGYIFKITDKNGNVTIGADSNGNAEFTGTIKAKSLDLSGCSNKVSTDYISGLSKVATSGKASDLSGLSTVATSGKASDLTDISNYVTSSGLSTTLSSYLTTDSAKDTYVVNTSVVISDPVVDTTTGITTQKITIGNKTFDYVDSGDFICTNIGIGKGSTPSATSTSTVTYVMINKDGCLTADNAVIRGTIYATNGYFSGKITSTSGSIGGFTIGSSAIYNGTNSISSTAGGIYVGTDGIRNYKDANTCVTITNGVLTANGATITGTISGSTITGGSINVNDKFKVDTSGNVSMSGDITLKGLTIGSDSNWSYINAIGLCIRHAGAKGENSIYIGQDYVSIGSLSDSLSSQIKLSQTGITIDGGTTVNDFLTSSGATNLNATATTRAIIPAANATYALGEYGNKLGWSNIYLGNAANTWNGLRIFVGTEARAMCGINADGHMTFGNTASTMYYNCKSIGALSSGTDEAFRISPGAYTANYNSSDVYLFGRRDSTSRFIGSYLVYARTYGSAANVVVTNNGVLGRSTSSSKRYKHDIREFSVDEVSCLYDLPLKKFKYNNDYISKDDEYYDKDLYGFIVEDLDEVLPISVQHNLDDDAEYTIPEMWNNNIIVPCLLKLIQDLNNRLKKVEEGKEI